MDGQGSVSVRRMAAGDLALLRRLRLAALADAPEAFCASLAAEEAMGMDRWQARLDSNVEGVESAGFFAVADGVEVGLAVGVRMADAVELNGMWVAPGARGRGAARVLVDAVRGWAREVALPRVTLAVLEGNDGALDLYRACGFEQTGRSTRADGRIEIAMALVEAPRDAAQSRT